MISEYPESSTQKKHTQLKPVIYRDKQRKLKLLANLNKPIYFGYHAYKLAQDLQQQGVDHAETSNDQEQTILEREEQARREAARQLKRFRGGRKLT